MLTADHFSLGQRLLLIVVVDLSFFLKKIAVRVNGLIAADLVILDVITLVIFGQVRSKV